MWSGIRKLGMYRYYGYCCRKKDSFWFGSQSETWLSLLGGGSEGETIVDFEGNQSFFLTLGSRRNF